MDAQKVQESQVFGLVLGTVVSRLRQQHGWTQAQLAAMVGVSQPVISRIESGKMLPDAFLYGRLAAAFSLTVQALDQQVNEALTATKRAAEAVSNRKSWQEVFAVVGTLGLIGLIGFAVAALLDGEGESPAPKPKPGGPE